MFLDLYKLYLKCFPQYPVKEQVFFDQLRPEQATIFPEYCQEKLVGFSMIHGNSITLLCVDPLFRKQGIGQKLLKQSEESIAESGYKEVILGKGRRYLLQGVPLESEGAVPFFQHRGYDAQWTSVNMLLSLDQFQKKEIAIPPAPEGLTYRLISQDEMPRLLQAVENAQPYWMDCFRECTDPILVAELEGQLVGFEIVAPEGGRFIPSPEKVGSIGCVGVVKEFRNRGIGMDMVLHGIQWLQQQGCGSIELLYVALVDWYRKLGFEVNQQQWMGEKKLP